ncbi:hypothetical protein BGZ70_000014 [Mortierella alpina]|uniref:Uncharacterized protein n=1 Tax=Mortierella alpina TaxID=64518 RepID=A0A9P6M7K8_MORAP|nr:hypothetical protein BGZ70_000014 [Mortierella alpina]
MNRHIPAIIAAGVGIMSGFYIWEPMFKKYQRESKGTWQYEVVQQTRAEEMNRHAEAAVASVSAANPATEPSGSSTPVSPAAPTASENKDLKPDTV